MHLLKKKWHKLISKIIAGTLNILIHSSTLLAAIEQHWSNPEDFGHIFCSHDYALEVIVCFTFLLQQP